MPTYEYECTECGYRFEAFQSMSDEPLSECEKCGAPVKRLISGGTGVIFKGSGFYVTDNKGKAKSQPAASSRKDESSKNNTAAATDSPETADKKTEASSGGEKSEKIKKETVAAK